MLRQTILLALVLVSLAACATGPKNGMSISGILVDRDTRNSIAGAEIFQIVWHTRAMSLEDDYGAVRWTTTDSEGRFRFTPESGFVGSRFSLNARTTYEIYHPEYGLVPLKDTGDTNDGSVRLEIFHWYSDPERLRRAVWEHGLSCPSHLPEFCLHRCRVMIGQTDICRDVRSILESTTPMPKDFQPARLTRRASSY